jgi:single-strand DNA-binding protein
MNLHVLAGNIGQDPRLNSIQTATGPMSVLNFSLAVQKRQKGPDGKNLTLWVECSLWGTRAESLAPYLKKGSKITVSGESDVEAYNANDGTVRAKMVLRISDLTMQGGGDQQAAPTQQQAPQQQQQQQRSAAQQQQPYNQPQQQQQIGYRNGAATPNNYNPAPQQQQNFQQQQPFNRPAGHMEPPIDFDDDIPF